MEEKKNESFQFVLILRDVFRSSVTLYKIRYYLCELFYHLSVKNLQEKSSLPSLAQQAIMFWYRKEHPEFKHPHFNYDARFLLLPPWDGQADLVKEVFFSGKPIVDISTLKNAVRK